MGVIRKLTSVVTVGVVDFRSDKERTALYTRQTRNAVEAQRQDAQAQRAAELNARIRQASASAAEAQAKYDKIREENRRRWG